MSSTQRSPITCHVLNAVTGKPGAGIGVVIERLTPHTNDKGIQTERLATGHTDSDGRCSHLLPPGHMPAGCYKVTFATGEYFEELGVESFYPYVEITFDLKVPEEHHHIPLLLSPYSYSTYRGS